VIPKSGTIHAQKPSQGKEYAQARPVGKPIVECVKLTLIAFKIRTRSQFLFRIKGVKAEYLNYINDRSLRDIRCGVCGPWSAGAYQKTPPHVNVPSM